MLNADFVLPSGRLDQLLYVDLPDEMDRKEILTIITSRVPVGPDVSIDILVRRTDRFTGADLEILFRYFFFFFLTCIFLNKLLCPLPFIFRE